MEMFQLVFVIFTTFLSLVASEKHEDHITFTVHHLNSSFISTFNEPLSDQGCDVTGNFSFIVHGWIGSNAPWISTLIDNLKFFRSGCVVFMNYSRYSDLPNYFESISHFKPVSNVLLKKLIQLDSEGVSGDSIFMFGFSYGGRIVIEAGANFGPQKINQIDSEFLF